MSRVQRESVAEHAVLSLEWDFLRNAELDPDEVTLGSHKRVWWLCADGHSWDAVVSNRRSGSGCPECNRANFLARKNLGTIADHPVLRVQFAADLNPGIDPATVSVGSSARLWWRCAHGHQWQAMTTTRQTSGCRRCSTAARTKSAQARKAAEPETRRGQIPDADVVAMRHAFANGERTIRELARAHNRSYGVVQHIVLGRSRLKAGGPVGPTAASLTLKYGKSQLGTYLADLPDLMVLFNPAINPGVDPSRVSGGSGRRVRWTCRDGHVTETTVAGKRRSLGCTACTGQTVSETTSLACVRPDLAAQWHPAKNEKTPDDVLATSHHKVWWLGECGHEWQREVYVRNRGQGCPFCHGMSVHPDRTLAHTHPLIAQELHPTRNDGLQAAELSAGSNRRVWWLCVAGHEWETAVASRTGVGTNCVACRRRTLRSAVEVRIAHELALALGCTSDSADIRTADGLWSVDFHDPPRKIVVEYDGSVYHGRPGYPERDLRKTAALAAAGWTVLRIRERPLPALTPHEVFVGRSDRIRKIADAVLNALTALHPGLATATTVSDYRATLNEQARNTADVEVAALRYRKSLSAAA